MLSMQSLVARGPWPAPGVLGEHWTQEGAPGLSGALPDHHSPLFEQPRPVPSLPSGPTPSLNKQPVTTWNLPVSVVLPALFCFHSHFH